MVQQAKLLPLRLMLQNSELVIWLLVAYGNSAVHAEVIAVPVKSLC